MTNADHAIDQFLWQQVKPVGILESHGVSNVKYIHCTFPELLLALDNPAGNEVINNYLHRFLDCLVTSIDNQLSMIRSFVR